MAKSLKQIACAMHIAARLAGKSFFVSMLIVQCELQFMACAMHMVAAHVLLFFVSLHFS